MNALNGQMLHRAWQYNLQEQSEDAVGHKYLIIAAYFISSSDALHFRRIERYQFKLVWSTVVFLAAVLTINSPLAFGQRPVCVSLTWQIEPIGRQAVDNGKLIE